MELEINVDEIIDKIKDKLFEEKSVWEEYLPIVKSEEGKLLELYFTEGINLPSFYNEACHELRHLPSDGRAILYINNGGGVEVSSTMLVDAIKSCPATTVAHLSGIVASAATVITMACDEVIVTDNLMFMVHESSFDSLGGKFSDTRDFTLFFDKFTKDMSRNIYGGFLTDDEIDTMHNGKEHWFNSAEVLERWERKKSL